MKTASSTALTKRTTSVLTPAEAKAAVYAKGLTLREFAKNKGISYRTLSEVIRGVNKGNFGEGHKAAVALGMKRG